MRHDATPPAFQSIRNLRILNRCEPLFVEMPAFAYIPEVAKPVEDLAPALVDDADPGGLTRQRRRHNPANRGCGGGTTR